MGDDKKTILIAEDEYGAAEVLQLILEVEGWRVVVAANGRQALERIARAAPDLVLADFMMPVMNGAQLGRALRANPATARVPIVMMSGAEESEVRREFPGYDAFLRKPYRLDELLPLVVAMLAGDRASDTDRGPGNTRRSRVADVLGWLLPPRPEPV